MPSDPLVDAGDIPQRQFNTARRGLDPGEVRAYLQELSETVAALQQATERERARADAAELRVEQAENPDQHRMVELLGRETARVLDAARDAARDIRAKAESSAERLISQANDQAHERLAQAEAEVLAERSEMLAEVEDLRRQAAGELEQRRAEAEQMVEEMRREAQLAADGLRQEGEKERTSARTEAEDLREAARDEARRLIGEAETMRSRVLHDLDRRRRSAREQLERLNGARSRLLAAYEVVRRTVDEATGELTAALPEAKVASEAAERRIQALPEASLEELEADVAMARFAGLLPPRPDTPELDSLLDGDEPGSAAVEVGEAWPTADEPGTADESAEPAGETAVAADSVVELEDESAEPENETMAAVELEDEPADLVELSASLHPDDEPGEPAELSAEPDGVPPAGPHRNGEAADPFAVQLDVAVADDGAGAVDAVDAVFARLKGGVVGAPSDDVLLRQRNETLEPLERALSRRLKRVLADEQNEVLDLVRRGKAGDEEDGLLPDAAAHADRYGDTAADELHTAAYWGAAAVDGALTGSCEGLIQQLGWELALPLRERVLRSVEETDGDIEELTARLRTLYREWKGQWVGDVVHHFVAAAYAYGAYDAAADDATLRWVVDPDCGPCPDATDNSLAGPLIKGQVFPSGHRAPPAHPGCRCLAMPVTSEVVVTPVGAHWA